MKVSVLLVTYNQANYIKECVESILMQQTDWPIEVVVADDHSSDGTVDLINGLLQDSGWQYRILNSSEQLGISGNYKRGFAACEGEYIAIIEGDDYWTNPQRLMKHLAFLDSHRECAMSFNRLITYNEDTTRFNVIKWKYRNDFEYITTSRLAQGNCIGNLSACVIRRSVLHKLNPDIYKLSMADWLLGMALGQYGLLAKLKEPMSVYRIHSKGTWSKKPKSMQLKSMIKISYKYDEFLNHHFKREFKDLRFMLRLRRWYVPRRISVIIVRGISFVSYVVRKILHT